MHEPAGHDRVCVRACVHAERDTPPPPLPPLVHPSHRGGLFSFGMIRRSLKRTICFNNRASARARAATSLRGFYVEGDRAHARALLYTSRARPFCVCYSATTRIDSLDDADDNDDDAGAGAGGDSGPLIGVSWLVKGFIERAGGRADGRAGGRMDRHILQANNRKKEGVGLWMGYTVVLWHYYY